MPNLELLGETDFRGSLVLGSHDSSGMDAGKAWISVRGGGLGSGAWIARITGTDPKYGLAREFVDKDESGLSRSRQSGSVGWKLPGDGVYSFGKFCVSSNSESAGYFVVVGGKVASLGNRREAVQKWAAANA